MKARCDVVVLHDRAAVGAGEANRVGDDPLQDLVEVQAGADGVADLAQSLELRDLVGELDAARLEGAHQLHLAHHDGGLNGKGAEQLDLTLVEGLDRRAPDLEHTDDLVVEDHRSGHERAVAGQSSGGPGGRIPRR